MYLSERLRKIASYVETGNVVADIGTDHAYIPIYLCKENIIEKAVACDVSKPSCEKAIENVKRYKFQDKIEVRHGDGLEPIRSKQVDTIVMAGMGGNLMIKILKKDLSLLDSVKRLILQPQSHIKDVRMFVHQNNYKIIEEQMLCEDKKYYNIIVIEKGIEKYEKKEDYILGKILIEKKDVILKQFLEHEICKMHIIVNLLKRKYTFNSEQRINELDREKNLYEEVFKCL